MSDVLYPVGGVASVQIPKIDRTLVDEFEDGDTQAAGVWPAKFFKRHFAIQHMPLTQDEFEYLRWFHADQGTNDSFWFRDNVGRRGNAKVRFAEPLDEGLGATFVHNPSIRLDEVAPLRNLVERLELAAAAGIGPKAWFDANRELYISHLGAIVSGEAMAWDAALLNRPTWATSLNLNNVTSQYQCYGFSGTEWAALSGFSGISAGACTIFALWNGTSVSPSGNSVLVNIGEAGTHHSYGIMFANSDGSVNPFTGSTGSSWPNINDPGSIVADWASYACVFNGVNAKMYVNAALIGTDAYTDAFAGTSFALGAQIGGTNKTGGTPSEAEVNHIIVFPAALTLAQIKAVHNLLAHQYGLAVVP